MKERLDKVLKQKYGPDSSIIPIEEFESDSPQHKVYAVTIQQKGRSFVVLVNMLKVNRGWQIQVFEQSHQVFDPA